MLRSSALSPSQIRSNRLSGGCLKKRSSKLLINCLNSRGVLVLRSSTLSPHQRRDIKKDPKPTLAKHSSRKHNQTKRRAPKQATLAQHVANPHNTQNKNGRRRSIRACSNKHIKGNSWREGALQFREMELSMREKRRSNDARTNDKRRVGLT